MKKRFATITATGSYLPEIRVHNDDLRLRFGHLPSFVDKMEASTGIRCRWYAPEGWSTSDLGLPLNRTHTIMEEQGYTGSACIPMALDDARQKGKLHPGQRLVLVGSGVGYNQAAVAFTVR